MILVSDLVLVCNMLKKHEDEQKCQALTLSKNVASKHTPVSAFLKIWIVMHCSVVTEIPLHPSFTRPLISPIPALVNGQCQNLSMPVRNSTSLAVPVKRQTNIAPEDMDRDVCCITQLLSINPFIDH